jgi:hypothetical protein
MKYGWLTFVLIACLILSLTGVALGSPLADLDHWAKPQIEKWLAGGMASGYPDNTFKPDNTISRAEFVSLANSAFGKHNPSAVATFKDVQSSDWFYAEIAAAQVGGFISGYEDGAFRPNNPVTRQDAASITARLLGPGIITEQLDQVYFKDSESISQWARAAVNAAAASKVMAGYPDGTFRPQAFITRAETLVMLDSALAVIPYRADEYKGITGHVYIDGKLVDGAVIKLYEKGKYSLIKEINSGSNGEYAFDVEAGAYDITAVKDNYVAYVSDLVVSDKTVNDITLAEGSVFKGIARDKNGNVLKNTTLTFTTNPIFTTVTDDFGNFIITLLPDRKYNISGGSGLNSIAGVNSGDPGEHSLGTLRFGGSGVSGGGGGGGATLPQASNFEMAGATFSGSGLNYTVNVSETTKVKEIKFDLNVNSDFEITELINQAGTDILPSLKIMYPAINTTGSVTAGTSKVINIVDLLAIPDPEDDGIGASYFGQLVNPPNTTGTMTIKIKLSNNADTSKQAVYELTVNVKKNEIPVASNFEMAGGFFAGSGLSYTVNVQDTTKVKNLKFDLNVNADFEITELINQAGTNILPSLKIMYPAIDTTGSVTAGAGRVINVVSLLAIPDPEGDGIAASYFGKLVNPPNTTGAMTIKIKLANSAGTSAQSIYTLTVNIVKGEIPIASNFEMAGGAFSGSGLSYTVNVQDTTKVKNLKFDLNVNADFEIIELINQAGTNILPSLKIMYPAVDTTGSVTAGDGRVINVVSLLAVPDPEGDGIAASYFGKLVNPPNTTGAMTIKIKLANSANNSAQATHNLTVNIM